MLGYLVFFTSDNGIAAVLPEPDMQRHFLDTAQPMASQQDLPAKTLSLFIGWF